VALSEIRNRMEIQRKIGNMLLSLSGHKIHIVSTVSSLAEALICMFESGIQTVNFHNFSHTGLNIDILNKY
jgi:hypothetical protein